MKPRGIVLIEGADAAGKTTLANHLRERYGARYLHSIVRRDIWRWHLGALRSALRMADDELVILDRHWLSEQAYGQVFRGGPAYDAATRCFDRVLQRAGAITVLCAPLDIKRQLDRHGDLKTKRPEKFDNIERVARLYLDLRLGNTAHPGKTYLDQLIRFGDYAQRQDVITYDVDAHGARLKSVATAIIDRLQMVRARQYPLGLYSYHYNLSGSLWSARYLFVGERVSPTADARSFWPHWPFTSNDAPPSAATWLNDALHALAIDETRVAMTNACDPRDDHLAALIEFRELLDRPIKVIALGKSAAARCRELGIGHAEIPHPQYWRRFHHSDPTGYHDLLKGALR